MKTRTRTILSLVLLAALGAPPRARAQIIVHDPASYAKLIEEARTALAQLEQLKAQVAKSQALFDSLNKASGVNAVASSLSAPALRAFLPDADAFVAAANGDLTKLGALAPKAQAIRSASQLYAPPAGDVAGAALAASGDRAARDLATAEAVGEAGAARLKGLEQLQGALGGAGDARAVLDLGARITLEAAMSANDQMRVEGLVMTQASEEKLALQRERERAAAASAARLALYRSAFQ